MAADRANTIVSSRGQVVLPKAIRERRGWGAGARLTVLDTPEGVLLRPASPALANLDDVFDMLRYEGPPVSLEDMDESVLEEARRSFEASVRDRD